MEVINKIRKSKEYILKRKKDNYILVGKTTPSIDTHEFIPVKDLNKTNKKIKIFGTKSYKWPETEYEYVEVTTYIKFKIEE